MGALAPFSYLVLDSQYIFRQNLVSTTLVIDAMNILFTRYHLNKYWQRHDTQYNDNRLNGI